MLDITPIKIRKARAFLHQRGIKTSELSPKDFVSFSETFNQSFEKTLRLIAYLKTRGQGLFPETAYALSNMTYTDSSNAD